MYVHRLAGFGKSMPDQSMFLTKVSLEIEASKKKKEPRTFMAVAEKKIGGQFGWGVCCIGGKRKGARKLRPVSYAVVRAAVEKEGIKR